MAALKACSAAHQSTSSTTPRLVYQQQISRAKQQLHRIASSDQLSVWLISRQTKTTEEKQILVHKMNDYRLIMDVKGIKDENVKAKGCYSKKQALQASMMSSKKECTVFI